MEDELDDPNTDPMSQKPKRPKRIKKNVNEKLEDASTGTAAAVLEQTQHPPPQDFGAGGLRAETSLDAWRCGPESWQ